MYNLFQCTRTCPVAGEGGQNSTNKRNERVSAMQFMAWKEANSDCFRWKEKSSWGGKSGTIVRIPFIEHLGITI